MPGVALMLPGQGAQAVGMGRAFYDGFQESREIYQRAKSRLGIDIAALCFEGPAEELTKTEHCQPALFVTSVAAYAALCRAVPGLRVTGAAGLSLGELTALTVANAMTFADALHVVQARAQAMAQCAAHSRGAMLAVIGLADAEINEMCAKAHVVAANFNAPEQVVLSGDVAGIEAAEQMAKAAGAKRAVRLEVAGAFHSPLMQPAADEFKKVLAKVSFSRPQFPVISNVTAEPVTEPEQIRETLVRQIVSPVRWDASVRWLVAHGAELFVELPPARVLTALLRRIDSSAKAAAIDEPAHFDKIAPQPAAS